MKIKLTETYSICKEKLRLSISEFINEEVKEKIFFAPDYSVFKNTIIFRCQIGLGGSRSFWTQFNGNTFTHISLESYKNKHRHRFNRGKDKDGNWTDIWTEPEYPESKIDYSNGFNVTYFGKNEFGLLNMYNLYLWDDINNESTHYKIINKFKTKKRTLKDGSIKFNDFSIIKTGRSDIDDEIVVILGKGTQEKTLFSVLKIDRKTKTCFWKFIENETPINLPLVEYPFHISDTEYDRLPLISDTYWNGNEFITFTYGTTYNIKKYGSDWKLLLKANIKGNRTETINQPKNICKAYFPTNNRYVIMKPIFNKDGKPYLFDLKTKEVIDTIKMPKGFSKFEIFDVTKNHLWAKYHIQNKEQEEAQIIKLEIENLI